MLNDPAFSHRLMPMQTEKDPAPINTLLGESSFASIIQKARLLLKIEQILRSNLPENFATHCHVLTFKDNTLILQVDNSSLATRLRYQEDELIDLLKMQTELPAISRIQIRTRPAATLKPGKIL